MNANAMRLGLLGIFAVLMLVGTVGADSFCVNPSNTNVSVIGVMWGNATSPLSPGPGATDVPLTIMMQSTGSTCQMVDVKGVLEMYTTNVNGVLVPYGVLSSFNGSQTSTVYEQSENGYSDFDLVFNLNLGRNFTPGPHAGFTYPLYISWTYSGNVTGRATDTYNIFVPVKGTSQLAFASQEASLIAGQVNNVTVTVTNVGSGTVTGISVPVPSSSGVELQSQPQIIGALSPGSSANLSFSVFVPPSLGGQEVSLSPTYSNPYGYGVALTDGLQLYVVAAQGTLNVSASTGTLVSGRVDNLWLNFTNSGATTVRNLVVTLAPGSSLSLLGSSGVIDLPPIPPGGEVSVPLSLYPTSSSSVASLQVTMGYSAGSVSRTLTFLTPGYINLSVISSTVLPSVPQPGQIFSLTSTLDNLGTTSAEAVSVTPIPPNGITVLGQSTTFVGDMGAYTPTAFTLSFTSSSTLSPGVYTIPVRVQYVNNIAQQITTVIYYTIGVGVSTSGVIAVTGNTVGGGGFGIGAGGFGGNFIRRNFTGGAGGNFVARNGSGFRGTSTTGSQGTSAQLTVTANGQQVYLYIAAVVIIIVIVAGVLIWRRKSAAKNKPKAHHA